MNPARRYAPVMTGFSVVAAALTHAAVQRGERPHSALEFTEAALATFFLARLVAKEKIGAVVREPFVEPAPGTDPADARGDSKQPTGDGMRYSMGELVTCTRCLGPWAASVVTFSDALAPRHARVVRRVLSLAGANILAQAAQAALAEHANRSSPV